MPDVSLPLRVVGIEILIPEPEVGIDHNWVAGFGFSEVGFVRNSDFNSNLAKDEKKLFALLIYQLLFSVKYKMYTLFIFYKHAVYKHARLQIAHILSTL